MTVRDHSIRHDPRAAEVNAAIQLVSQRAGSLTSDRNIYAIVADAMAHVLEFDRLRIELTRDDNGQVEPVFVRGGVPSERSIVVGRSDPLVTRTVTTRSAILYTRGDLSSNVPAGTDRFGPDDQQVIVSPVIIDDQTFGTLDISSKEPNRFSERDLWIVETVSNVLGLVLAGSRHRKQAHERAKDTELLFELGRLTHSHVEPNEVLRQAAERVGRSAGCDVLVIRCGHGAWTGDEPYVRDASRLRALQMLLNRIKGIRPTVQLTLRQIENDGRRESAATQDLAAFVSEIEELLEREEIDRLLVLPFTPHSGDPLLLVALRESDGDREFSDEDRAAIEHVMRYMIPALINATLRDDLARALREREAFHRMSTAIGAGKDTADRVRIACRTVQLLSSCDYVALTDWSSQPPNLRFVVGSEIAEQPTLLKAGTITAVRRSGDVRIINDFPDDPPLKVAWYPLHLAEGLRASLTYRLQWSGTTFGSLIMGFRKPRHFSEADLRFAESMAQTIVASLGPDLHFPERHESVGP